MSGRESEQADDERDVRETLRDVVGGDAAAVRAFAQAASVAQALGLLTDLRYSWTAAGQVALAEIVGGPPEPELSEDARELLLAVRAAGEDGLLLRTTEELAIAAVLRHADLIVLSTGTGSARRGVVARLRT